MQVESFLEQSAREYPDKVALVSPQGRFTYAELNLAATRLAHALREQGVRRGDRVAIYLENSAEAVVAVFAVLKLGAVFVLLNPGIKADKLSFILNDCRAVGLVASSQGRIVGEALERTLSARFLIVVGEAAGPSIPGVAVIGWDACLLDRDQAPIRGAGIDLDLATIIYTSGSTGFPKGVMMTHLNMVTAATSISQYLEIRRDDVILNVLPLSFDYGLYQVLMAFKAGATVVLERSFIYPAAVIETLTEEAVTGLPVVPTLATMLIRMGGLTPGQFPSVRYITSTAAALHPAVISELRRLFPAAKIFSMYGLTECKRVSYLPPDQLDARPASVGKAIPNTEVWLVNDRGERVGPGTVGELVVRGSHVMRGYWERPEETARALRPGPNLDENVLYTGDLFTMDDEGYLYFVGRKDDVIKTRGEKVSPKEVEAVLYSLPAVAEAAVVGVPDDVLGQAVKAVIVLAPGANCTEQDILRHCAEHLEGFMVPRSVEFCEVLPKTMTGKIETRSLRGRMMPDGDAYGLDRMEASRP